MAAVDQTEDSAASLQTLLAEMLAVLDDELDFVAAMHRLLAVLTSVFACQGARFFRFDEQKGCLVLICASGEAAQMTEGAEFALGERTIGLAAQQREPVFARGDSPDGNRSRLSGGEDALLSQLALPLLTKDGSLIGILTLLAADPHVLGQQQPTLSAHIAPLVAGVVEHLRRNEQAARWKEQLVHLAELSQITSARSELGMDEVVQRIATLAIPLMHADLVVILLSQPNSGQLVVRGAAPQANCSLLRRTISVEAGDWQELRVQGGNFSERLNPVPDRSYATLLSAPLVVGNEFLGLLNCYWHAQRPAAPEEQALLAAITSQTALAMKLHLLSDPVVQKQRVDALLGDLLRGTYDEQSLRLQAATLGFDLTRAHVVALVELIPVSITADEQVEMELASAAEGVWLAEEAGDGRINWLRSEMRRRLLQMFPGSFIAEQEYRLTCLLNLSQGTAAAQLTGGLRELVQQGRGRRVHLFLGVSTLCQDLVEYRRGFLEAEQALRMARRRKHEGGVMHFNDLGVYRYIMMAPTGTEEISDRYLNDVRRLDEYDGRKGSQLLDTLETFLECAGNLTDTSAVLNIHRNTLIQRLERMKTICQLNLDERSNWLPLQVAIKWLKLQA